MSPWKGELVEGLEGLQSPVLKTTLGFTGARFGVPQVMVVFGYGNGFGVHVWMGPFTVDCGI